MSGLIVIGYDGSDEAGHAIDAAATILRATGAVVANVWRPAVVAATTTPLAAPATPLPTDEEDAALERAARSVAEDEADLVVVGRRGVSRLEAVVLGSVSNDTVREARRPVLVVPFADG